MTFQDDLQSDLDDVVFNTSEFAEAASLTPVGGDAVDITIIRNGSGEFLQTEPGQGDIDTFLVRASDYSQPAPNDSITIDSVEWNVQVGFFYVAVDKRWSIPVVARGRVRR